jgi:hypothetical protein
VPLPQGTSLSALPGFGSKVPRATQAEFLRDFEGQVKGPSPAVFNWLVMRQGVESIKPDVHVHRFTERAVGRRLSDDDVVQLVMAAARTLGYRSYEMDWAKWEFEGARS